jgi:hypothetical protein
VPVLKEQLPVTVMSVSRPMARPMCRAGKILDRMFAIYAASTFWPTETEKREMRREGVSGLRVLVEEQHAAQHSTVSCPNDLYTKTHTHTHTTPHHT